MAEKSVSASAELTRWLTSVCPGWRHRPPWEAAVIYRVFGSDGALLYIGMSIDLKTRFMRHWTHSDWCPGEVDWITLESVRTLTAVRAAETAAIIAECPRYNRVGTPRDGRLRANRG